MTEYQQEQMFPDVQFFYETDDDGMLRLALAAPLRYAPANPQGMMLRFLEEKRTSGIGIRDPEAMRVRIDSHRQTFVVSWKGTVGRNSEHLETVLGELTAGLGMTTFGDDL